MSYNDTFRLSAHGVLIKDNQVLQLKATYGNHDWGLPGGAFEPGETIHEALHRECWEEIGIDIQINYLSGIYYHSRHNSQAFIFRISIADNHPIRLSKEHSAYRFFDLNSLNPIQNIRINDCLNYSGEVKSYKF